MSTFEIPAELIGRRVRVVGLLDIFTLAGDWRGYARLVSTRTGTEHKAEPGRIFDDEMRESLVVMIERAQRTEVIS